jgi:hypothetical protein
MEHALHFGSCITFMLISPERMFLHSIRLVAGSMPLCSMWKPNLVLSCQVEYCGTWRQEGISYLPESAV